MASLNIERDILAATNRSAIITIITKCHIAVLLTAYEIALRFSCSICCVFTVIDWTKINKTTKERKPQLFVGVLRTYASVLSQSIDHITKVGRKIHLALN